MANQDKDQAKIAPMEQNSNRGAKTGLAGPKIKLNQSVKKNPMSNGKIRTKRGSA